MYNIREVQLVQLDILKQVIALCEKHNIKYYAVYGTLLGAVRHKGFIPWDDDIDIAMLRPDFDRFCEIAEKELQKPYFLQTNKTDPEYYLHIARVQNLNTTLIEKAYCHLNIKFGICIDIYPLDGVKNTRKYMKQFKFWDKLYKICVTAWIDNRKCWKKYVKLMIDKIVKLVFFANMPLQYFCNKTEELYRKITVDEEQYIVDYHSFCCSNNYNVIYNKDIFSTVLKMPFENVELNIPNGYDEFLRGIYGDYMCLPPENKRVAHHEYVAVDAHKSYTQYLQNIG